MFRYVPMVVGCTLLAACSSGNQSQTDSKTSPAAQPVAAAHAKNPAAKYVELVGFRVGEKGPGKLEIKFGVVNHSEADLGDLSLNVDLRTTTSKPVDPPLCSFSVKVPALGPNELKEVAATVSTKLRAYELPDWQYLRPDFVITEPK